MIKTISKSFDITVASGVGDTTTTDFKPLVNSGGKIKRVVVVPPSETSKHSFYINDSNSIPIFKMGRKEGTAVSEREVSVEKGVYTLGFSYKTDAGDYTIYLTFDLNW